MRNWLVTSLICLSACDSSSKSSNNPKPEPSTIPLDGDAKEEIDIGAAPIALDDPATEELKKALGKNVNRESFLRQLADDFTRRVTDFRGSTEQMQAKVEAYCAAPSTELKTLAQDSWRAVMSQWQYFELFQIGPIAEGGKTLKSEIYVWPDPTDLCKIDETVLSAASRPNFKVPRQYSRRGLSAMEYLLFESSFTYRCPAEGDDYEGWAALDADQRMAKRCAYMVPLSKDIAGRALDLETRWGSKEDNVITRSIGNAEQETIILQALFDGLFYADIELKNKKLAGPAGLDVKHCDKSPAPCAEKEEFVFSKFSRQAVDQNIAALLDLMFGPGADAQQRGGGFSALVRSAGNSESADRSEQVVLRLSALTREQAGASLDDLIATKANQSCEAASNDWLCRMHGYIKAFASEVKNEYSKILGLNTPAAAQGDND